MKKLLLTVSLLLMSIFFSQNLYAIQTNEVKVVLTLKVKNETKKEFIAFLNKNLPNVRAFHGCKNVKLYFNNKSNEMIISENWSSKKDHLKYIKFISQNGVMKELASFLQKKPSIKYYDFLNI